MVAILNLFLQFSPNTDLLLYQAYNQFDCRVCRNLGKSGLRMSNIALGKWCLTDTFHNVFTLLCPFVCMYVFYSPKHNE